MPWVAPVALGISAAASAASAIHGLTSSGSNDSQAQASDQQADQFRQKAADLWDQLQLPNLDTTPYQGETWLQDYVPETYDPWIGQVYQMSDDPAAKAALDQSIAQLQGFAKGGLQPADLVALDQIRRAQARAASSQAASVQDNLAARGLAGSGAELAGRLAANQQAANSASDLYDNALQTALQRQLSAITTGGQMAANERTQSANISQAMANINNQFNTEVQNLRTAAAANAANVRNQAQLANLSGRQSIANANVQTANQNLDRANQIAQQNFLNQQTKIAGQSNAYTGQATQALAEGAAASNRAAGGDAQFASGLQGLTKLAGSFAPNTNNNNNNNNNGGSLFSSGGNNDLGGMIPIGDTTLPDYTNAPYNF